MLRSSGRSPTDANVSNCLIALGAVLLMLGDVSPIHAQPVEYNGSLGEATSESGTIGWGTPTPDDPYDWYCIRGTAGQEITLTVERTSGTDEDLTPNLAVWSGAVQETSPASTLPLPSDGLEQSTANSSSATATLSVTPTRNGPFTVSVSAWTATQDGAAYEISASAGEAPANCGIGTGLAPPVSITPVNEDDTPLPADTNTPVPVEVTVPSPFDATSGTVHYRNAGTASFPDGQSKILSFSGTAPQTATVDLPANVITARGVQAYVELSGSASPFTGTVTAPFSGEEADTGPTTSGVASRTFFLPADTSEVGAEGVFEPSTYRMLSVPVAVGDSSAFDLLKTEYGLYDEMEWRFGRWAPQNNAYRFGDNVDPLQPGEAAWLADLDGDSLTIDDARSPDAAAPAFVTLQEGWNQVGSPFAFDVAWADVQAPSSVGAPVDYNAARPSGSRFRYEADSLAAWGGAFVYVNPSEAEGPVTIQIPPTEATSPMASSNRTRAKAGASGYRLQAIATLNRNGTRLQDRKTWLGFSETAASGYGPKDLAKPPAVGPHVRLYAMPNAGPGLARSLRPQPSDGAAWNLRLTLDLEEKRRSTETVTVQLAEQGARPDGFRRYVIDRDRNERLPITNQSVQVPVKPNESTRRLRVVVGTEAFAKRNSGGASLDVPDTALLPNAPNPFRESTTLSYQLAKEQPVTIAIYDLLGRRVTTLVDGPRERGVHQIEWSAGEGRTALSSGVYICRMQAGAYTGTRKLVLVR